MKLRKNRVSRVLRGGNYDRFMGNVRYLRVISRDWERPVDRWWYIGFRFVVRGQK